MACCSLSGSLLKLRSQFPCPYLKLCALRRYLHLSGGVAYGKVQSNLSVSENKTDQLPSTYLTKKVKRAVQDVGYSGIIVGGVALTGLIFYVILSELFSKKSPNGVYKEAFNICKNDARVQDLIGSSIKAHGETNSRGRRRHTAHQSWYDDHGKLHMAMKFYLQGNLASAIVQLEVVENQSKDFEYRYLIVETEGGFTRKQVIIRSPEQLKPTPQ